MSGAARETFAARGAAYIHSVRSEKVKPEWRAYAEIEREFSISFQANTSAKNSEEKGRLVGGIVKPTRESFKMLRNAPT